MKNIFLALFVFLSQAVFAQEKINESYLVVRFSVVYDNTMQRNFVEINAEAGCDTAFDIYELPKYNPKKNVVNDEAGFYYNKNFKPVKFYNYFLSVTEAINFLVNRGWVLVTVYSDTFSGYTNERDGQGNLTPVTTITSAPVFLFKK